MPRNKNHNPMSGSGYEPYASSSQATPLLRRTLGAIGLGRGDVSEQRQHAENAAIQALEKTRWEKVSQAITSAEPLDAALRGHYGSGAAALLQIAQAKLQFEERRRGETTRTGSEMSDVSLGIRLVTSKQQKIQRMFDGMPRGRIRDVAPFVSEHQQYARRFVAPAQMHEQLDELTAAGLVLPDYGGQEKPVGYISLKTYTNFAPAGYRGFDIKPDGGEMLIVMTEPLVAPDQA